MISMSVLPRILVVEDQSDVRQLLTELLFQAGYESTAAPNCDEALAAVLTCHPNLALIDLAIPGCDDITVLRALHAIDPDLPVIIITRNGSPEEVRAAMINGAYDFYTRPFDNRELLASIADALASRKTLDTQQEISRV